MPKSPERQNKENGGRPGAPKNSGTNPSNRPHPLSITKISKRRDARKNTSSFIKIDQATLARWLDDALRVQAESPKPQPSRKYSSFLAEQHRHGNNVGNVFNAAKRKLQEGLRMNSRHALAQDYNAMTHALSEVAEYGSREQLRQLGQLLVRDYIIAAPLDHHDSIKRAYALLLFEFMNKYMPSHWQEHFSATSSRIDSIAHAFNEFHQDSDDTIQFRIAMLKDLFSGLEGQRIVKQLPSDFHAWHSDSTDMPRLYMLINESLGLPASLRATTNSCRASVLF